MKIKLLIAAFFLFSLVHQSLDAQENDAGSWSDSFYHWGALLGLIDLIDKGYVPSPQSPIKYNK